MATAYGVYVTVDDLKSRLGISGTTYDTLLGQISDETNQWIESYTGRVLAPVPSATYLFDGYGLTNPYVIQLGRLGARTVTLLEAGTDGVTFETVGSTRYTLLPRAQDRALSGEPAYYIHMTDGYRLYGGYGNVRITMEAGFEQIPDDVRAVAIGIATRAWRGRETGMADVIGDYQTQEDRVMVTKIVPLEFKNTLDRYRPVLVR
jgi:hypothetical protein